MRTEFVGVLLMCASLTACRTSGENLRDEALLQLSVNRQKWSGAAVHNYSFDYDIVENARAPSLHVTVENDLVSNVRDRDTGATYANSTAPTVDSLFAGIETLIRNPSASIRVTYDGQLGFPAQIDEGSTIPDTGATTKVTNFQATP